MIFIITKVVHGNEFHCFESFVTDYVNYRARYIASTSYPKTIPLDQRFRCEFELKSESDRFIFIITNGYLRNVRITSDKVVR